MTKYIKSKTYKKNYAKWRHIQIDTEYKQWLVNVCWKNHYSKTRMKSFLKDKFEPFDYKLLSIINSNKVCKKLRNYICRYIWSHGQKTMTNSWKLNTKPTERNRELNDLAPSIATEISNYNISNFKWCQWRLQKKGGASSDGRVKRSFKFSTKWQEKRQRTNRRPEMIWERIPSRSGPDPVQQGSNEIIW